MSTAPTALAAAAPRPGPAQPGLRGALWAAAGFSAVISLLMLTGSIYMLQVYDRVLASGSVPTLVTLFAIVVVLFGFLAVYDALRMRLLSRLAMRFDAELGPQAFRTGLRGEGPQALRDIETLRAFLAGPAMLALFDLPFVAVFLAVLFVIHPLLGWLTVGGMAAAAGLALLNRMATREALAAAAEAERDERDFAERARRAGATVGALGMAGAVTRHWQGLHEATLAAAQRGAEPAETLAAVSRTLRLLLQSVLLTAGAWLVIQGAISAGSIIASSILAGRALAPVDQLIGHWRGLTQAAAARRRLAAWLAGEGRAAAPGVALPTLTGAVAVKGLMRSGPARPGLAETPRILDGVSFTLAPGEGLGVIGASASGKSTLARLLVGAITPDAGEIRFDGATRDQWDPDRLGAHVGYLPQHVELLPGTVRDNIARFDVAATDAAVMAAARAAGVHEMILALPEGYGTDLGRAEVPLSGGQIQRIGLARALYGAPRVLVLDEPNAHLDMAGEAALTRALMAHRAAGATVIVMAHRASALAAVSRIMVLQGGRVVQEGPRDKVLALLGAPAPVPDAVAPAAVTPGTITPGAVTPGTVTPGAVTPGAAAGPEDEDLRLRRTLLFRSLNNRQAGPRLVQVRP